ncbi:hypothetical protein [Inhella crocodyli]|uniref:Uncharacterized protein n=1 Tax=Inhella crocodyli TaxID=2499851 RepID=A0A437LLF0_9BURK|nr:hypothetical protein [Inhella crocodyli]RVT86247.1 hypothetical protein EOD73_09450 [Inhella crocodyli]
MPSTTLPPTPPSGSAQAARLSHRAALALAVFRTRRRKLTPTERSVLQDAEAGGFDLLAPQSHCWRLTMLRELLKEGAGVSPL